MTTLFLASWVLFPVILVILTLGCGLLVRRLAGDAVPGVLLLPVGLAAVIVVSVAVQWSSATAALSGPALIALSLLGYALSAPHVATLARPTRDWLWPGLGAFGAFAALAAPVVLAGRPGFSGYTHIVDIGHVFDFAAHLAQDGRASPGTVDSSFEEVVSKMLSVSYPAGAQGPLGALARTLGVDVPWLYQPLLAFHGAITALAVYGFVAPMIQSPLMRALAAAVSAQPSLLYGYALTGGIKELIAASMLVLVAALLRISPPGRAPRRALLPAGLAVAAAISAFMVAIGPWVAALFGALLAAALWRSRDRVRTVAAWTGLSALIVVLALPTLIPAFKILRSAAAAGGAVDLGLGNLSQPLSVWASAGVWVTGDYRFPLAEPTPTYVLIAIVLLLAAVGVAHTIRLRDPVAPALALAAAAALAWVTLRTGPWIELKAFAITGMISVAFGFIGAAAVASRFPRAVAWGATLVVAGAVLWGNARVYHAITVAPAERFRDLERIGDDFAGSGPTLYPAFEEYAEYFLREVRATSLVNPARGQLELRPHLKLPAGQQFGYDLDQFELDYLQSFSLIVQRRDPRGSRPPSNWLRVRRTRFHEVWRRARPATAVRLHLPLSGSQSRPAATCRRLATALRSTDPRARVAYAMSAQTVELDLAKVPRSANWPADDGTLVTFGPGSAQGRVVVPRGGRYEAWLGGSFGRGVTVSIDGQEVATLAYRPNYPRQIEYVGEVELDPGPHRIRISRGGGDLRPGNGDEVSRFAGPLILERLPDRSARVRTVSAAEGERICRGSQRLDWIEVVEPA
ncbi:MAG TPA: hypothetical protein VHG69_11310 [Thermoleophilaceae bacterium]|nr:hypothetical protein [Thermoleophilaceae bacterium]